MCDNYPPGAANDPNAPYNQVDPEPIEVDVVISQTLSRSATIEVTNYTAEEWKDVELDEDGHPYITGGIDYNFSDCDFREAYMLSEFTIPELLEELKLYLTQDIESCPEEGFRKRKLQKMLKCCNEWTVDETEVIKD